jgi:NAD(P)-dependent dehydrogenase (short-subunit alcohol dehydrogenase family)
MNIKGKTALVTGGAVRVGKAITLALAREGANVIINYNSSADAAEETKQEAEALGVKGLIVQADVGDYQQVKDLVSKGVNRFGGIDILVNSASLWRQTPFPMNDLEDWHLITNILINGSFYCANEIAPLMLKAGQGEIINIIDLSAFEPWPNFIAHSVGKSALLALSRQLALELAPNVKVNAIAPGPVLPPSDYSQARIDKTAQRTLLNRWGTAEDIAKTALFFIQSDYITGEVLSVDGGERFGHRKVGD